MLTVLGPLSREEGRTKWREGLAAHAGKLKI